MCVCVCILDHECFAFFLLRDVFESLTCWLNLCLSSLLVAFISMCFSSLKKLFFIKLDSFSTDVYPSRPLDFFSQQILSHLWSIEKLYVWPIDSRQFLDPSRFLGFFSTHPRQILLSIKILLLSIPISSFSLLSCISCI